MNLSDNDIEARIREFRVQASLQMHERTLGDALAAQSAGQTIGIQQRRTLMMKRIAKIAAAVVMAVGIIVLAVTVIHRSPTVAFAQVREQILKVQSMTWKMTMTVPMPWQEENDKTMTTARECFYKEPGLMRQVSSVEGQDVRMIIVWDLGQGVMLSMHPKSKMAMITKLGDPSKLKKIQAKDGGMSNFMDRLRRAVEGQGEPLGEKVVDGRPAIGFHMVEGQMAVDIWVDVETAHPLLIEMEIPGGPRPTRLVMTDMVFDVELDDSLFSVTPPPDYKVQRQELDLLGTGLCSLQCLSSLRV